MHVINMNIYDTRTNFIVAELEGIGNELISCNASGAAPFDLVAGYKNGDVSLIDMRTMTALSELNYPKKMESFPYIWGRLSIFSLSFLFWGSGWGIRWGKNLQIFPKHPK